ncbi:MAG: hypothetical protein CL413_01045 [Acidimicrobiaceae bacterium]|nr:hypothetical protein [Acidimicrobiaceae bacterium]
MAPDTGGPPPGLYHRGMTFDRSDAPPPAPRVPLAAKIAVGALALWGTFTVLDWFISSALRLIRFGLFVVIVIALFGWAVSAKGRR